MNIVIQCAARKHASGSFRAETNKDVLFVGDPGQAPYAPTRIYARPDDRSSDGRTWRERLVSYNQGGPNPLGFLPAGHLYRDRVYASLIQRFGAEHVFILSAGWGLIPSTYLTPMYDITFSSQAEAYKRRRLRDQYDDLRLLPDDGEHLVFLGGQDYLDLFVRLTMPLRASKTIYYTSNRTAQLPAGYELRRFETTRRTNWHYAAAATLVLDHQDGPM